MPVNDSLTFRSCVLLVSRPNSPLPGFRDKLWRQNRPSGDGFRRTADLFILSHKPAGYVENMMDKHVLPSLVLASQSPARARILSDAGFAFETVPAFVDEEGLIADSGSADPDEIALKLAAAKARKTSAERPSSFVIGADQVLAFKGRILQKPKTIAAARARLLNLSGQTHNLVTAVSLYEDGHELFHHVETAVLKMALLDEADLAFQIEREGEELLKTVGCYRLEGPGIRLFTRIEGDYFAMLGLPLLPLLTALRRFAPELCSGTQSS